MCDELHATHTLSEKACHALRAHFSEEDVLELLYTAGQSTCVSHLVNALALAPEVFAARFAECGGEPSRAWPVSHGRWADQPWPLGDGSAFDSSTGSSTRPP